MDIDEATKLASEAGGAYHKAIIRYMDAKAELDRTRNAWVTAKLTQDAALMAAVKKMEE